MILSFIESHCKAISSYSSFRASDAIENVSLNLPLICTAIVFLSLNRYLLLISGQLSSNLPENSNTSHKLEAKCGIIGKINLIYTESE